MQSEGHFPGQALLGFTFRDGEPFRWSLYGNSSSGSNNNIIMSGDYNLHGLRSAIDALQLDKVREIAQHLGIPQRFKILSRTRKSKPVLIKEIIALMSGDTNDTEMAQESGKLDTLRNRSNVSGARQIEEVGISSSSYNRKKSFSSSSHSDVTSENDEMSVGDGSGHRRRNSSSSSSSSSSLCDNNGQRSKVNNNYSRISNSNSSANSIAGVSSGHENGIGYGYKNGANYFNSLQTPFSFGFPSVSRPPSGCGPASGIGISSSGSIPSSGFRSFSGLGSVSHDYRYGIDGTTNSNCGNSNGSDYD
jgi:hypothetical protein